MLYLIVHSSIHFLWGSVLTYLWIYVPPSKIMSGAKKTDRILLLAVPIFSIFRVTTATLCRTVEISLCSTVNSSMMFLCRGKRDRQQILHMWVLSGLEVTVWDGVTSEEITGPLQTDVIVEKCKLNCKQEENRTLHRKLPQ